MTPSDFAEYLRIAKSMGVLAFHLGPLSVQFLPPEMDPGLSGGGGGKGLPGDWKSPKLDHDPETDWD